MTKKSVENDNKLVLEEFDASIVSLIEELGGRRIGYLKETKFEDIDVETYSILAFEVTREMRSEVLEKLGNCVENPAYMVFYSGISYDESPELICILKSRDQYDILRALKTNGVNYDIYTDDLILKLSDWDRTHGVSIIGADGDWVDIKLMSVPEDLEKFAEEVYEFCPDSVDQGVGDLEELQKHIKESGGIFLWWD